MTRNATPGDCQEFRLERMSGYESAQDIMSKRFDSCINTYNTRSAQCPTWKLEHVSFPWPSCWCIFSRLSVPGTFVFKMFLNQTPDAGFYVTTHTAHKPSFNKTSSVLAKLDNI